MQEPIYCIISTTILAQLFFYKIITVISYITSKNCDFVSQKQWTTKTKYIHGFNIAYMLIILNHHQCPNNMWRQRMHNQQWVWWHHSISLTGVCLVITHWKRKRKRRRGGQLRMMNSEWTKNEAIVVLERKAKFPRVSWRGGPDWHL